MKIFEVRDGFIKFEADKEVFPADFILIEGAQKKYIGQITQIRKAGIVAIAYAKILYNYDGEIKDYDNTLPAKEAIVNPLETSLITKVLNYNKPVIIGKSHDDDSNITIDYSVFNKNLLISTDDKKHSSILVRNLVKQFKNIGVKTLVIDTLGTIDSKKYYAGRDFKLPLDTNSLAFMYDSCLNDATEDSKSTIVEIFKDLSEYSKTVPFVPFEILKSIVDDMVNKSHIFKLLVLKNKLDKYNKLGYFATEPQEVQAIHKLINSNCAIIDLSKLDSLFLNRFLSFIYEVLANTKEPPAVLLGLSNAVTKKNIKQILASDCINTSFITHSGFKYLSDIKNLFENFLIEPSFKNNEIFKEYSLILKSLSDNSYIITGKALNNIVFASQFKTIDNVIPYVHEDVHKNENTPQDIYDRFEQLEAKDENNAPDSNDTFEENVILDETNITSDTSIASDADIESASFINEDLFEDEPNNNEFYDEELIIPNSSDDENTESNDSIFEEDELSFNDIEADDNNSNKKDNIEIENDIIDNIIAEYKEEQINEADSDDILGNIVDTNPAVEKNESLDSDTDNSSSDIINTEAEDTIIEQEEISNDIQENITNFDSIVENNLSDSDNNENIQEAENVIDDFSLSESINSNDEFLTNYDTENESQEVLPISDNDDLNDLSGADEIIELDLSEAGENDIVVDMDIDENDEEDIINQEIVNDVDKVFTTRKEDSISDSDLDLIDEINSDEQMLIEESDDENLILEQPEPIQEFEQAEEDKPFIEENVKVAEEAEILERKDSSTPIVPVYDAEIPQEDIVTSDPIQQGDTVSHAKYGTGVVEKMIKYGNKTLYAINFDNIGRRLLDPTLTEIKKC